MILRGETAIFQCKSEGFPPPQVSWKFIRPNGMNGNTESIRYKVQPDNSLVLADAQNKDEGLYVCISESPGLKVNTSASLTVNSKLFL